VEDELMKLREILATDGPNNDSVKSFETLEALRNELNVSINKLKESINRPTEDPVLEEQKNRIVMDVMPDYLSRIENSQFGGAGENAIDSYENQLSVEKELIAKLITEQNQVAKQLNKNPNDEELGYKRTLLEAIVTDHRYEVSFLEKEKASAIETSNNNYIQLLRTSSLGENQLILNESYSSIEASKSQEKLLLEYEQTLTAKISELEAQLKKQTENFEIQGKRDAVKLELSLVSEKRRQVNVTIGELETEVISDEISQDPEIMRLSLEKQNIENALNNQNLTAQEEKRLNKELKAIESAQSKREVATSQLAITNNITELNRRLIELEKVTQGNTETQDVSELALVSSTNEVNRSNQLKEEAEQMKEPEAQKYLLVKSNQAIENALAIVQEVQVQSAEDKIEQSTGAQLDTEESLTEEIRQETNRLNQLNDQYNSTERALLTANRKEKEILLNVQKELNMEIDLRKISIDEKLSERQKLRERHTILPVNNQKVSEQEISQESEVQIASSNEYADYYAKVKQALLKEQQIATLDAKLTEKKNAVRRKVYVYAGDLTSERIDELKLEASKIAELENELNSMRSQQEILRSAIVNETNLSEDMRLKMQSLVLRGIAPIDKMAVIASLVSLPANGLSIGAVDIPNTTERRIPVNVKIPKGLVYRVQIGAFANPIPADRFSEFNPVSGEKLNNGITRYLAGYFNNSKRVVEARDQIKALGYVDAFAVAYCDGKRITLAEARIMEANGTCIPMGENELNMELVANTAMSLGIDTSGQLARILANDIRLRTVEGDTNRRQAINNYTYNQAPGAAPANAIEKIEGLFYTVQIGVYNNPVAPDQLFNLSPLMTILLPNNQIRYSFGMFISEEEARIKREEALARGANDAFVTAYYNGERISIAEAQILLKSKENLADTSRIAPIVNPPTPLEIPENNNVESPSELNYDGIQFVTKRTFNEYPVDVLNRYNARGSFYYDETDKRVKSVIYPNEDALPQVFYFKDDIDTLKIVKSEIDAGLTIALEITTGSFDGEFTDWLLRQNYRRELVKTEEKQVLRLCNIPEDRLTGMTDYLTRIGISYNVLK
jgi:hypothetical protein